jgi:hypothetical protein
MTLDLEETIEHTHKHTYIHKEHIKLTQHMMAIWAMHMISKNLTSMTW